MKNNIRKVVVMFMLVGLLVISADQTSAKWAITDPDPMLKVHTTTDWIYHDVGDLRAQTQFIGPVKDEWKVGQERSGSWTENIIDTVLTITGRQSLPPEEEW